MTSHPEEGTLHAFIDGELPANEAAALELHVAGCARCAAALAEARGLVAGASRTISALDAAPASAVSRPTVRVSPAAPLRTSKRAPVRIPFARAAAVLLLAGGSAVVITRSNFSSDESSASTASLTADAASMDESAAAMSVPAAGAITALPATPPTPTRAPNQAMPRAASPQALTAERPRATPEADFSGRARVAQPGRAEEAAAVVGSVAAAPPAPSAPPAPAVLAPPVVAQPSARRSDRPAEIQVRGAGSASTSRVTRFRTREGVILTLIEAPLRSGFTEAATAAPAMARDATSPAALRVPRTATQSAQSAASAPSAPPPPPTTPPVNSYTWTSAEQGRTYTLTGPFSVAELEALARRLGQLERLP